MSVGKKPRKPLPRSAPLPRGGRVKPRNAKRHAANLERAHGDPVFRRWIHHQPCLVCGRVPSDPAHLKSGGAGRKDDVSGVVPLCADYPSQGAIAYGCHAKYDGRAPGWGKRTFRAKYPHLDLEASAVATQRAYDAYRSGGLTPIAAIVPAALAGLLEDAGQVSACDPDHFVPSVVE